MTDVAWYALGAGILGAAAATIVTTVWFTAAVKYGAVERFHPKPRMWIVDCDGMWWLPCEGGGYVSTHDTRPPSPYSVDQIAAEAGIRRVERGGPARVDDPEGSEFIPGDPTADDAYAGDVKPSPSKVNEDAGHLQRRYAPAPSAEFSRDAAG